MRIIAGTHKGRRLAAPAGRDTRPMTDRTRGALFNILAHSGWGPDDGDPIADAVVLDAFAGTGALALEALSRGAREAWLFDLGAAALAAAERNIAALGEQARARTSRVDATRPPPARAAATLAFVAPPYGRDLAAPTLAALDRQGWLAPGCIVAVELGGRDVFDEPPAFVRLGGRRYGDTRLVFLRRSEVPEGQTKMT